jgi:hypothetical protein
VGKHYIGDIGTIITVDCGTTISGATNTKLKVKKPDVYYLQSSLTISGWTGLGETANFTIYDPYK